MSYESFSYYYDSLMDESFYTDYLSFILKHARFERVLELGCGTGKIALPLASLGKKVVATDLSNDMLNVLRDSINDETLDVYRIDMRSFEFDQKFDLVLCLCDSLNYLLNIEDVLSTFKHIYDVLDDRGTFIFDVDSLYKMNVLLNDYHEYENDGGFEFKWDVEHIDDGEVMHHIYIKDMIEDEEIDEYHHQITYDISKYVSLLKNVGFKSIKIYSDFEVLDNQCERYNFVCRKGEYE